MKPFFNLGEFNFLCGCECRLPLGKACVGGFQVAEKMKAALYNMLYIIIDWFCLGSLFFFCFFLLGS